MLKDIVRGAPLDTEDVGKLRSVRDRMMRELGLTRKQADAIMAQMFKNWKPQKEVVPKINKAAAQAERRVQRMASKIRGTRINFSDPNTANVLNGIDRIIQRLGAVSGAARQASQVLSVLSAPKGTAGYSGGRPKVAWGGTLTGPRSGYPVEMHGTETVVSHRYPERGMRDLSKYGLLEGGGSSSIAVHIHFDGPTYSDDIEQAAARAARAAVAEVASQMRRRNRGLV